MIKISTLINLRRFKSIRNLFFLALTLFFTAFQTQAQIKTYANKVNIKNNVENSDNAVDSDLNNFATVKSWGGLAFGAGSYIGELELEFPEEVLAGTTSYIRIDYDSGVLDKLLGGSLGGVLSGVVGGVILGNHYFEVGARDGAGTDVLKGRSNVAFTNSNLRILKDATGKFYIAITPNVNYRKVYVKDFTTALLLALPNSMKVYSAFYTKGIDPCGAPLATGFDGEGLTLDLLGLGKAGVTNMEYAIDGNSSTHSDLTLGVLGVAGSISQNFYFNTPSNTGDDFNLKLKISPALLSANILNNLRVTAYDNGQVVFSQSVSTLLNLDLLGLLQSGNVTSIPFSPGVKFDQVKLTLTSILSVDLTQTIEVYELTRSAGRPTFSTAQSNNLTICNGGSAILTATTSDQNNLIWYDSIVGGNVLATVDYDGGFNTGALTGNKRYYVAAKRKGCTEESARVPVIINVLPEIIFNTTTLANATNGFTYNKQINLATGGSGNFTYSLATGSVLPAGLTLSNTGFITGTPTVTENITFSITATDAKLCAVTKVFNLNVVAGLAFAPNTLPQGITGTNYGPIAIATASGGTIPYTYTLSNLPPGLSFNETTLEITGIPSQKGDFVVPVVVKDFNGNAVTANLNIKIIDPLVLPSATLANGLVGTLYTPQIIPTATGGSLPYQYTISNLPLDLVFNDQTREITGTPKTAGDFIVKVTVTDANGTQAVADYNLKVLLPLALPSAVLPDGNVGIGYSPQTLPAATGGVGPYTYVATGVPAGLSFDSETLIITGTPSQAGSFIINLVATDKENNKASNSYTLKVIGTLSLDGALLADGILGTPYITQTLPAVVGGVGPYNYVLTGLPDGLNFNTTTREITGTPNLGGVHNLTLTVTDQNGNTVTANYSIKVIVNAPTVVAVNICSGKTATIVVGNLQSGVKYNWYPASGNTALQTNNDGVFTTGILTSNTTFYVEAISGTGVSTRTAVVVTVNPAPNAPTILTANQNISTNQSTTLLASTDAGNTINWYSTATGGSLLATGNSFTTPILNVTTIYYAETLNSGGCASLTRSPVTITVTPSSGSAKCNYANRQNSGISGICLLCSVSDANQAIDGDLNTATRITLAVGVASTGYQQLIFPSAGQASDSIKVYLGLPVGLADISLLSNITVNVLNGASLVKNYSLNPALLNIALLGGNKFSVTLPATGIYDRIEVKFGGLASVLGSLDIYGTEVLYARPTISATPINICAGNTATINVTANGGTTLNWFEQASGGASLATGNTFTTPVLTATTTYYIEVSRAGCVNTERVAVKVNVTGTIAAPVLESAAEICAGSTAILAVKGADEALTYKWYESAVGGTVLFTGKTFTTPVLVANKDYYLEASLGDCISPTRTLTTVKVNARPIVPTVKAAALTINAGQTALLSATSTETDVTFKWYESASSTTAIYTGDVYVTRPLTANTTFFVEAQSNITSCPSESRIQITINVIPAGPVDVVPCESAITQTNGVNGIALLAGVFNPNLAIDDNKATGSSLVIPVGILGGSVYQNLGFSQLSKLGDTVKILLSSPGKLLSLSLLADIKLTTYAGATSNTDEISLNNNLVRLELLTGNSQALISFVPAKIFDGVEVRLNSGLLGALTSININYAHRVLSKPDIEVANVITCVGQPAELKVKNPDAGFTYRWYNSNGDYLAGKDGTVYTIPSVIIKEKYFVAAVSGSDCLSAKTEVNVDINTIPNTPELILNNITTCNTSDVTLEVKNPVAGYTYKWYDQNNVYQTLKDGITFKISNVTASTSYSVKAENTCGISIGAASATISVGMITAPTITPAAITISKGSSAVLTATSGSSDAIIKWYDSDLSVIPIYVGNVFVTPSLLVNTTYYAEATVPICGTSARSSITVTVGGDGTQTPLNCGFANTSIEKNIRGGIALLAGVLNEGLAVDALANTGSTLYMPVSLNASVYHRIGFDHYSKVGDTLKIKISSPGKLLSLGVLSNLKITTYNNNVSNADAITLNSSVIHLELLSAGGEAVLSFVPSAIFNSVELSLASDLLGVLTTVNFDYAQMLSIAPSIELTASNVCQGESTIISVINPQVGATYKWYRDGAYLSGKDGNTLTTDAALAPGSYQYQASITIGNGCETKSAQINLTVTAKPLVPIVSLDNPATTCFNSPVTLKVNGISGVVYNWYDAATAGNILASNNSNYTTLANLSVGIHDFYVEAVNGSNCSNTTRAKISLEVKALATAADIIVNGADKVCHSSTATFTASSATVQNPKFKWYADATLTTLLSSDAIFSTTVTANATYYVVVSGDNKCENNVANAKAVSVTVNPIALATDIALSGNVDICAGSMFSIAASSITVINPIFKWYSNADLTTKVFEGNTFTQPSLSATTTYYVTVSGDNKCDNSAATAKSIVVKVNPIALLSDLSVTGNATLCKNSVTVLTASSTTVTNPIFTWYSDSSLSTVVHTGVNFTTPNLTTATTYYVTVKGDNKCESNSANATVISIKINDYALDSDILLSNTLVCSGSAATLRASSTTVLQPVFTWYTDASLTAVAFRGPTFVIPLVTAQTTYYVTVKGEDKCENVAGTSKMVSIDVNPLATSTDIIVNGNTAICGNASATLNATSPLVTNPIFTWYTDSALSNVVYVGANFITPVLTANVTYYVTVRGDNRCENATGFAKVIPVNVNPLALATDIALTGNTTLCKNTGTVLSATSTITNAVFTWYSDSSLSTSVYVGANFTTPNLLSATTYYVTVKGDNKCENNSANAKAVTLNVNEFATGDDIILNNTKVCAGSSVTLNASSTTVLQPVFNWYSDASLTSLVHTGPTYTVTSITSITTYFVTVKGSNKCENVAGTAKAITIDVNPLAAATDITLTGNTSTCSNSSVTLIATSTTVTNPIFTWYNDSALTDIAYVGASFATPTLSGNTTYYVTVKGDNKCENAVGAAKAVTITVNSVPATPILAINGTTICSGSPASISVSNAVAGVTYEWYTLATGGTAIFSGNNFNTPILNASTDYFVQAINAAGCVNATGRVKITVTVNPKPVNPVLTANAVSVCSGSSAVLSVANAVAGVTYNWYSVNVGGVIIGTGNTFTTPAVNANSSYYVEAVAGSCTSSTRAMANVTVLAMPVAPVSVVVSPNPICGASSTLITIANPDANYIYRWYTASTGSTSINEGNTFTTPNLLTTTNYYVEAINKVGGCVSISRTLVTVNVLPVLSAPVVRLQSAENNRVIFAWNAVNGALSYEYSIDKGATWLVPIDGPLALTATITGLKAAESVEILVRAKGQLACQTSANSSPLIGEARNALGNEVYIPNAFTPNNDGKNDVFLVYGNTIKSVQMTIYTQWGQQLYQSQSETPGWDGTFKGVSQPNGVYVYLILIESKDGSKTTRKGTVTLIR